ncbi:MAG: LamG domain-containing protein [Nanoarchaeota archaeon]|nr:LamG domain-containing protein [Nanoarchaeota archaeon]
MVYKKYVWKNGKKFGPYYYESYRDGDKIRKKYIGTEIGSNKNIRLYLLLALILVALLSAIFIWQGPFTGRAVYDFEEEFYFYNYTLGESLKGNFRALLEGGELIPHDSKVIIQIGNESKEMILRDLVSMQSTRGNYYLSGFNLSGNGEGFGIAGMKTVYPAVNFQLEIYKEKEEEIQDDENEEENEPDNELEEQEEIELEEEQNETISTVNGTEDNETAESSLEMNITEEEDSNTNLNNESEEDQIGENEENEPDNELEEQEENDGDKKNKASGSLITGASVFDDGEDDEKKDEIINGTASRDEDFTYNLPKKRTAKIVSGSLYFNGLAIGDDKVKLEVNESLAKVSTNYSVLYSGFGADYKGGNFTLLINLSKLDVAVVHDKVRIIIEYNGTPLLDFEQEVNIKQIVQNITNITNVTIPENLTNQTIVNQTNFTLTNQTNFTLANQTNETIFNFTFNFTPRLSMVKEIVLLKILGNEILEINLSNYFIGADSYNFEGSNIIWNLSENILSLKAEEDFRGYTDARISAYLGNLSISSKDFTILISEGDLQIQTLREKIVLNQPVRWIKNITNDVVENITIELPADAWNITVKKIEGESTSQASASIIGITGSVIEGTEESSLFASIANFFRGLFGRGITGRVVALDESINLSDSTNSSTIQVRLSDTASSYIVEYSTNPPVSTESIVSNGKYVVISATEHSNYSNTIASTSIDNRYEIKSGSEIKVHWYNRDFNKPGGSDPVKSVEEILAISETEDTSDLLEISGDTELSSSSQGTIISTTTNVTVEENNTAYENATDNSSIDSLNSLSLDTQDIILESDTTIHLGDSLDYALQEIPFLAEDYDEDGNIDHISWVVPHFSNQSYQISFSADKAYYSNIKFDGNYAHLPISDRQPYKNGGYGLVAYWNFDGDNSSTVFDYSNNNLHGRYYADALSNYSSCLYGGCLKVNGTSSSYVNISDSPLFDIGVEGFTYTAWINPTSLSNSHNMFMGHHLPYFNVRSTGVLHMSMGANGSQRSVLGNTVLTTNKWYFVAATYNSSGYMHVYLNGTLDGTPEGPHPTATNYARDQFIGTWNEGLTLMFNGSIDEVMIFNYSLNDTQIRDIFLNQSARFLSPGLTDGKQIQFNYGYGKTFALNTQDYRRKAGSNISAKIGYWDKSKGYKDWDFGEHYLDLDANDYVNISDSASLEPDNFTISYWSYFTSISDYLVLTKDDDNGDFSPEFGYSVRSDTPSDRTWIMIGTGTTSFAGTTLDIVAGKWHHFTYTYNWTGSQSVVNSYLDGTLKGTVTNANKINYTSSRNLFLGSNVNGIIGRMDEFMFFNNSLGSKEVSYIYNLGRDVGHYSHNNLVSRYDFNKGVSAVDLVGNNHGTFNGDPFVAHQNNSLIGYWHLDSDYGDYSGRGNNGTTTYNDTLVYGGIYNQSATFDGGDYGYATIPANDSLNHGDTVTISAWIKPLDTTRRTIYSHGSNGAGGMQFEINGQGAGSFGTIVTGIWMAYTGTGLLNSGQWNHVTYTRSGAGGLTHRLYLNGVAQTLIINDSSSYASQSAASLIGARTSALQLFNGSIDELIIFNRSLTSTEVAEIYARGRARWEYTDSQNLRSLDAYDNRSQNTFYLSSPSSTNILPSYILSSDNSYFYTPLLNKFLNATANIVYSNVTTCNATLGCLFVRNKTGTNVAVFDKKGNLDIKGVLSIYDVGTPDGTDFIIKNITGSVVAWIDGTNGNMKLAGSLVSEAGSTCTPPDNSFIIKNNSGGCVSYIDSAGNVWLKGLFNQNSII